MSTMSDPTMWPLRARVGPGFLIRAVLIAIMCLVFGIWGIYDYVYALPGQSRAWHRAEVARTFNRLAEPIANGSTQTVNAESMQVFSTAVLNDLKIEEDPHLVDEENGLEAIAENSDSAEVLNRARHLLVAALLKAQKETQDASTAASKPSEAVLATRRWLATVAAMVQIAQTPTTIDGTPAPQLGQALALSNAALQKWGDVQPPSKYDRPMQWIFILCLPFVPWYAWQGLHSGRRRFQLDQDGTLHLPQGTWPKDQLATIDMHRWMAKSKAWAVHVDGTRVLLDDYVYKGLWKIVGALAAAQDPDTWTTNAKLVKALKQDETPDDPTPEDS
jgi:hypothetical protein